MANFFIIEVTLQIFLVMFIGWVLKQVRMFDDHFVSVAINLIIK